jgi:basic amino acid/polyamine antiporter, APA family
VRLPASGDTEPAASPPRTAPSSGRLLRLLGVGFGVAVTIGGMVGVGILRTPGAVAAQLPHVGLIALVWAAGGAYALFGTLCVIELGAALPSAGGWYVYARRAFGDAAGFTVGWSDWLAQTAAVAYLAVSMGDFGAAAWPALGGGAAKALSLAVLAAFALVQYLGLRSSSLAQELTSFAKCAAFLGFVAVCFLVRSASEPQDAAGGASLAVTLGGVVVALQAVAIACDGWYTAIYFTEEDRDPGRNLPRSALGGVAGTIAIYALVNAGFLHSLGVAGLGASAFPAADVAQAVFGGRGGAFVNALSLVSLLSVVNAVLMLDTRILFAIARDGLFVAAAAKVSPHGTPVPAMLMTATAAALMVATGTFEELIAIASVLFVGVNASGFLALMVLRRREPRLHRPFRVPGYPWVPIAALLAALAFLAGNVVADPRSTAPTLGLVAASYPIYRRLASGASRLT